VHNRVTVNDITKGISIDASDPKGGAELLYPEASVTVGEDRNVDRGRCPRGANSTALCTRKGRDSKVVAPPRSLYQ
jgi:hypothetical protein